MCDVWTCSMLSAASDPRCLPPVCASWTMFSVCCSGLISSVWTLVWETCTTYCKTSNNVTKHSDRNVNSICRSALLVWFSNVVSVLQNKPIKESRTFQVNFPEHWRRMWWWRCFLQAVIQVVFPAEDGELREGKWKMWINSLCHKTPLDGAECGRLTEVWL